MKALMVFILLYACAHNPAHAFNSADELDYQDEAETQIDNIIALCEVGPDRMFVAICKINQNKQRAILRQRKTCFKIYEKSHSRLSFFDWALKTECGEKK